MRPDDQSCPLCPKSAEDADELRVHMHVEHRKSDLVDFLVEEVLERDREELLA